MCEPPAPTNTYLVELGWGVCYCPEREEGGGGNVNAFPERGRVLASIQRAAVGSGKKKKIMKKGRDNEDTCDVPDGEEGTFLGHYDVQGNEVASPTPMNKGGRSVNFSVNESDRARVGIREGWLNDNAVNFLTRWEVNRCERGYERGGLKVCVFNSFFATRLFDCLDARLPRNTSRGKFIWETMESSTPEDLWGSRYLLMPINYNGHWSLVLVANATTAYEDWNGTEVEESKREERKGKEQPAIVLMDSGRKIGAHAPQRIYRAVRVFLNAAWNGRYNCGDDERSEKVSEGGGEVEKERNRGEGQ